VPRRRRRAHAAARGDRGIIGSAKRRGTAHGGLSSCAPLLTAHTATPRTVEEARVERNAAADEQEQAGAAARGAKRHLGGSTAA
jgi:hypothetical protein